MAKAYKCDKCLEYVSGEPAPIDDLELNKLRVAFVIFSEDGSDSADLCTKCKSDVLDELSNKLNEIVML